MRTTIYQITGWEWRKADVDSVWRVKRTWRVTRRFWHKADIAFATIEVRFRA